MNKDKLYSIGNVAELLKLPVHTVRYWTETFEHIEITIRNGRRYYDTNAIEELKKIKELAHKKGLKIEGIKKMLRYHKIDMKKIDIANSNEQQKKLDYCISFIDKIIEKIDKI